MTGSTAARGHRALLTPSHRRESPRPPAGSAAATRRYRALFPCTHCCKTAWPGVKGTAAVGSDLAAAPRTKRGKTTRSAMKRAPTHGSDLALLFGIHRRETAPRFRSSSSLMAPPAAWRGIFPNHKTKSVQTPRSTIARGNFSLPSCLCHNIPFSLATERISTVFSIYLAGYMPAARSRTLALANRRKH